VFAGRTDDDVKAHATAPGIDRALANLERRQLRGCDAQLICEPGDKLGAVVGLVEIELDRVVAIGIELQLISSSS